MKVARVLVGLFLMCILASPASLAADAPFGKQQIVALTADAPTSIAVGDIDGDGDGDVVSASFNDVKLAWYANLGGGKFGPERIIATDLDYRSVVLADVDDDGDLDVVAGTDNGTIEWHPNADGAGNFAPPVEITDDFSAISQIVAADFNRDGRVDVAAASDGAVPEIRVYLNGPSGFGAFELVADEGWPFDSIAVVDLDRDGALDLVSGGLPISAFDSGLAWWRNDGGSWTGFGIDSIGQVDSVTTADLNRDGFADVISAGDNPVVWHASSELLGEVSFGSTNFVECCDEGDFHVVVAADVDGDGDPDLVAGRREGGIVWYENDGSGAFSSSTPITSAPLGDKAIALSDVDADGDLDVFSASLDTDKIAVYRNRKIHRNARFAPGTQIDELAASTVAAADLDRDGDADLISTDIQSEELNWYPNVGGFGPPFEIEIIDDVVSVDVADFDGDGTPDVVSGAFDEGRVAWHPNLLGTGPEDIEPISPIFFQDFYQVHAADIDGDGDPDVVTVSVFDEGPDGNVIWWENDGSPASFPDWELHTIGTLADEATSLATEDLDRDGDVDVVVGANGEVGEVVWFRNDGIATVGEPLVNRPLDDGFIGQVFIAYDTPFGVDGRVTGWRFYDQETAGRLVTPLILERVSPDSCLATPDTCEYAVRGIGTTRTSNGSDSPQEFLFDPIPGSSDGVEADWLFGWKDGTPDAAMQNAGAICYTLGADTEVNYMAWGVPGGGPAVAQDGVIDNPTWNFRLIGLRDYSVQFDAEGFNARTIAGDLDFFVRRVVTADLDGDGDADVLTSGNDDITWYENTLDAGGPESWPAVQIISGVFVDGVATADLDNDGDADVLAALGDPPGEYRWFENEDGAGTFGESQLVAQAPGARELISVDLDRDGDLDLVGAAVGDGSDGELTTYDNIGGQYRISTSDLVSSSSFDGGLVPLLAIPMTVNARPGDSVAELAALEIGLAAGGVAEVVQFDLTPLFNADVIVNNGNDGVDPTQDPIDLGTVALGNYALVTQSAADELCGSDPDGIPDDGFFPANGEHPDVQLAYDNADNGNNARRSPATTDFFTIVVPPGRYSEVHLFATTGDGSSDFTVSLNYSDESFDQSFITVPDWFTDPPPAGAFYLLDMVDRINPGSGPGTPFLCDNSNDPAIFGSPFFPDPQKTLVGITLERTDTTGAANVFGATGVRLAALDSGEAAALIEELRIYRDDGSGQFEQAADTLLATYDDLTLDGEGFTTLALPEDNADAIVAAPATFLLVAELTANASEQSVNAFQVTHRAAEATAENAEGDVPLLADPPEVAEFTSTATFIQPAFVVDSGADDPDETPGDGECRTVGLACTLRAAVEEANARPGDDLIVVPEQFGPYVLNGQLLISDTTGSVTIRGDGPGLSIIDGGGVDRVFWIDTDAEATLEGLTIRNGFTPPSIIGGGIVVLGALTVDHCEITSNTSGARGGGLAVLTSDASCLITNSTISNNTATSGAGLDVEDGTLELRDSVVSGNDGEGILVIFDGVITVVNSTISGNTSGSGANVVGNTGPGAGSSIDSSTIVSNTGNGIFWSGPPVTIRNSIVADNGLDVLASPGNFTSLGYNLIGDKGSNADFVDDVNNDQVGGGPNPVLLPLVGPLSDNGGSTLTHELFPGSPAIDAGSCPGVTTDQRGAKRAVDLPSVPNAPGGNGCDIGAYEAEFASVLVELEIPIRWCAVEGTPSIPDPSVINEELIGRLDRATDNILEPAAGIVLRSGATVNVESFPFLTDPKQDIGLPGDVFVDPATANFDEVLDLFAACRQAWEQLDPEVVGLTAVHINRFVDASGAPLKILGLGGRAGQNNAEEQLYAGRMMVVDHFYRLAEDPFDSLLAHEAGHGISLEHGNGLDDNFPPDGLIDNDDDKAANLPKFDGPNLMQYRKGAELTAGQVERARTHAFVTIPDSKLKLAGVLSDKGEIDGGFSSVLDFGFSSVLDFNIDDIAAIGATGVLDGGFSSVLDFSLAEALDAGFSSVLDFGFSSVLDFGVVFGGDGVTGDAAIVSTTKGVFWPSPLRPNQTLMYCLNVDPGAGTGKMPGDYGFPDGGGAGEIDLIVQVDISSSCSATACTDSEITTVYRYVQEQDAYLIDPDAVLDPAQIDPVTIGLVVDNGGETIERDDQKIASVVTTRLKSGVLVEAGAKIGMPIRMETISIVKCGGELPGGDETITIVCQCNDCEMCPDFNGCVAGVGTPDTVPEDLVTDVVAGIITFVPPALPTCSVSPAVVDPGTVVTVTANNFTDGAALRLTVGGNSTPFVNPTTTAYTVPANTTASKIKLKVELVNPVGLAQVGKCSVKVNANVCAGDTDGDTCDDCGVVPFPGDPSNDGADFDGDGLCDAGDPDDDNDGVADALDLDPLNRFVCGFAGDDDACDDCSCYDDSCGGEEDFTSPTFDPLNDGLDTDGDGLCDEGDTDDDSDSTDDLLDPEPEEDGICGDFADGDGCDDCANSPGLPDPANDGTDGDMDGICSVGDPNDNDPNACGDFADGDLCDDCSSGSLDPLNDGQDTDSDGVCDLSDACTDADGDGLGNGNLGNSGCGDTTTDANDSDPFECADTNANGCDDCQSGMFDPANDAFDSDQDGLCDSADNCPDDPNPLQEDLDGDDVGDVCDSDADGDGVDAAAGDCNDNDATIFPGADETLCDGIDQNCNGTLDDDKNDDGDPVSFCDGDCDDQDGNNYPGNVEVCDAADNDCNGLDDFEQPGVAGEDVDSDGVCELDDNCPTVANPDQEDFDGDGEGDLCETLTLSVELDPQTLWPPNHKMQAITATATTNVSPQFVTIILEGIVSDEPDNGAGDGNTVNDIQGHDPGNPDFEFELRAERSAQGDGRVYSVTYSATAVNGSQAGVVRHVLVPLNQGGAAEPLILSLDGGQNGTVVDWAVVPYALYYNVIRGSLSNVIETEQQIDLGSVLCVEAGSLDTTTAGSEDLDLPLSGEAFFYLAEYNDGWKRSYGTESTIKPRVPGAGACE